MRHWGCGPLCHTKYVTEPDEEAPTVSVMAERGKSYLALPASQKGICGACAFIITDAVLNVTWHSQVCSPVSPAAWAVTSRFTPPPGGELDLRTVYLLPELRAADAAKRTELTVDSAVTAIFSPARSRDTKPDDTQTGFTRLMIRTAWPDGFRVTAFGRVPYALKDFTCHGNKKGSETDLGSSKASPALQIEHGHQSGYSTGALYQVLLLPVAACELASH